MSIVALLFWFSIAALFYIYLGYPLLAGIIARLFPNRPERSAPPPQSASVIISCYGEAPKLSSKIENILSCENASSVKEILVGLDGATTLGGNPLPADPRIRLIEFPERRGKPSVLNDLIKIATGDILIMMDVRQRLDTGAISALLENFSDPRIGVVSGELIFESGTGDSSDAASIDLYWKLEKWLRNRESLFSSVPGATGALYAIRRNLAKPIPSETALDDVLIPMQAIAQGYRCVFEPQAKMYDRPAQDAAREAIRKRRTLAGCVQLLVWHPLWMLPFGHPIWWQFGSHKIVRLFSPFMLMLAAGSSALLATQPLYAALGAFQIAGYGIAIAGLFTNRAKLLRIPAVFLKMQGTLLQAWWDGLTRKNLALWDRA